MVRYLVDAFAISIRRACRVAIAPRSTHNYRSQKDRQDNLRIRLRDLAYSRVSYGYQRIHVLLRREGFKVNHKRVYRLYTEEGLTLKRRKPKRYKALAARHVRVKVKVVDDCWTMDFMSDHLADGRRYRVLTIIDVFSRECLALMCGQCIKGGDVVKVLDTIKEVRDPPKYIHCDNGSEFTSKAMDQWAWFNGVRLDFSRPGKPTDNAYIESFNGKVRQECLNLYWFNSLKEVETALDLWKIEYNMERPHSSLNNQSPYDFVNQYRKESKYRKSMKTRELIG